MKDPILLPDGVSYERAAIQAHLNQYGKSPKTDQTMTITNGFANIALKSLIQRYLHPDSDATAAAAAATAGLALDIAINAVYEGENIHVQVRPNATEARPETIIVAMVDTSGSMDLNAAEVISRAEMNDVEITRLQLVQFSMKTVVNSLESRDGLVLYRFAEDTQCVLTLTRLDAAGKASATTAIDGLRSEGGTSIWEAAKVGAQTALELQTQYPQANIRVMLFTDGEPTCRPPQPEIQLIKELLDDMPQRRFTISTFSYGYSIDSGLMDGIAALGWGVYGYCPDASLVGTIFINYLAQAMNCLVQHMEVEINGRKSVQSLHIANPLNFLIRGDPKTLQVTVRTPGREFTLSKDAAVKPAQSAVEKEALLNEVYRQRLIALVRDNLSDPEDGLAATKALQKEIKALPQKTPFLTAVLVDLVDADASHGQVEKSFDPKFYGKWGKDYLRSFARFHELETCGNFKDESLQLYQTPQFGIRRRAINKIFMSMPPLKGRRRMQYDDSYFDNYGGYSSSSSNSWSPSLQASQNPTVRQDDWYDRMGGCWDGDALVAMYNGVSKRTCEIQKGDVLESGAVVECVVELVVNGMSKAVRLGGALWTPWHPVRRNAQWVHACTVGVAAGPCGERLCYISSWYDLVVRGNPIIRVNGIETVTLGHGLKEDIVGHEYFGTHAVVDALKKRTGDGYRLGHVRVAAEEMANTTVRDKERDGMVVSMY